MLPLALRANQQVAVRPLAELSRAAELSQDVDDVEAADALLATIEAISTRIGIPRRLSEVGVRADQIPVLVRDSRGNSMDGNSRAISDMELTQLLEERL
jgi:1,3-propanediol dehydrogenase